MDLRTKLVFALVLVSLGSMLLLTMLSYGPARDLWRQSALETLEALAESKKLQIAGSSIPGKTVSGSWRVARD